MLCCLDWLRKKRNRPPPANPSSQEDQVLQGVDAAYAIDKQYPSTAQFVVRARVLLPLKGNDWNPPAVARYVRQMQDRDAGETSRAVLVVVKAVDAPSGGCEERPNDLERPFWNELDVLSHIARSVRCPSNAAAAAEVKVARRQGHSSKKAVTASDNADRSQNATRTLSSFDTPPHHPHIVPVLDVARAPSPQLSCCTASTPLLASEQQPSRGGSETDGYTTKPCRGAPHPLLFFVMPYYSTGTLRDWSEQQGLERCTTVRRDHFQQIMLITAHLCDALHSIHEARVIHGDMKLENVYVTSFPSDWGPQEHTAQDDSDVSDAIHLKMAVLGDFGSAIVIGKSSSGRRSDRGVVLARGEAAISASVASSPTMARTTLRVAAPETCRRTPLSVVGLTSSSSPERESANNNDALTSAVDMWGVGCILYELLGLRSTSFAPLNTHAPMFEVVQAVDFQLRLTRHAVQQRLVAPWAVRLLCELLMEEPTRRPTALSVWRQVYEQTELTDRRWMRAPPKS